MQFAIDTNVRTPHIAAISTARLWTGWGISGLVAAFALFDRSESVYGDSSDSNSSRNWFRDGRPCSLRAASCRRTSR
jgi:hypothetical protein